MKARGIIAAALGFVALCGSGCATPCASTGWRFEVGRPSVFQAPGIVQQQSGPISVSPLGTTLPPTIEGGQMNQSAMVRGSSIPHVLGRTRQDASGDCTLEDVCQMLRRIEQRLTQRENPSIPLPMPKGNPNE